LQVLDFRNYRRPHLGAIAWGINVATVLNMAAMLASGEFGSLPRVVRAGPLFGLALAVIFNVLGMRSPPKIHEASQ